jgi:hypothetical protein
MSDQRAPNCLREGAIPALCRPRRDMRTAKNKEDRLEKRDGWGDSINLCIVKRLKVMIMGRDRRCASSELKGAWTPYSQTQIILDNRLLHFSIVFGIGSKCSSQLSRSGNCCLCHFNLVSSLCLKSAAFSLAELCEKRNTWIRPEPNICHIVPIDPMPSLTTGQFGRAHLPLDFLHALNS